MLENKAQHDDDKKIMPCKCPMAFEWTLNASWDAEERLQQRMDIAQKKDSRKPRKIGVWVSGAELQSSAVDTRTAVWVSTPEKFSKIVLGTTRKFSRKFRGGLSAGSV